ncbi:MAG: hypothetical protein ACXU81_04395 [Myxococcaceae bacterium]
MCIQIERTESGVWARVRSAVACFLCLVGLPFLILVIADVQREGPVVTAA